jgi:uncharacterized membrane protein
MAARPLLLVTGASLAVQLALAAWIALAARDPQLDPVPFIGIGVGGMLVVVGILLPRTRSNWFLGIRTPWTLSSERSWEQTHRVGGYLFIAIGVIVVASALLLSAGVFFGALMIGLIGSVAFLGTYSYLGWRDDPHRSFMRDRP